MLILLFIMSLTNNIQMSIVVLMHFLYFYSKNWLYTLIYEENILYQDNVFLPFILPFNYTCGSRYNGDKHSHDNFVC